MEVPKNAFDLVIAFEGFYSRPYLCPASVPTIGFGTIRYPNGRRVTLKDEAISKETALAYAEYELKRCLVDTVRICPVLLRHPSEWLGAIVDFVYNLGAGNLRSSALRRKINEEEWEEVPFQLSRWVYGGGKKLKGLVLRREMEANYFV